MFYNVGIQNLAHFPFYKAYVCRFMTTMCNHSVYLLQVTLYVLCFNNRHYFGIKNRTLKVDQLIVLVHIYVLILAPIGSIKIPWSYFLR